jgi:hypothetical protein
LGKLRKLVESSPKVLSIVISEMVARVLKVEIRRNFRVISEKNPTANEASFKEFLLKELLPNFAAVFSKKKASLPWVSEKSNEKFKDNLDEKDLKKFLQFETFWDRFENLTGIFFSKEFKQNFPDRVDDNPQSILRIVPTIKNLGFGTSSSNFPSFFLSFDNSSLTL